MKLVGSQALKASRLGGPRPQRLPDGTWVTAKSLGAFCGAFSDFFTENLGGEFKPFFVMFCQTGLKVLGHPPEADRRALQVESSGVRLV